LQLGKVAFNFYLLSFEEPKLNEKERYKEAEKNKIKTESEHIEKQT
jgi:hypothetical protein